LSFSYRSTHTDSGLIRSCGTLKDFSNDVQKASEIAKIDDKNVFDKVAPAHQETRYSDKGKETTFGRTNKSTGFRTSQDKASKIPRMKPNSFSSAYGDPGVYPVAHRYSSL